MSAGKSLSYNGCIVRGLNRGGITDVALGALLCPDWRDWFVAMFAVVWVANQNMSTSNRFRLDIKWSTG